MHYPPVYPPLYDPSTEHDACGVGFVAHLKGQASHRLVADALQLLENMSHRGASGCEPDSGDGAGIMVQTPDAFLRRRCGELGIDLPPPGRYAVGMLFLPQDLLARRACEHILEQAVRDNGMVVLGWRDVPVDSRFVGPTPRRSEPKIRQIFVGMDDRFYNPKDFDRRLYLVRQRTENLVEHSELWGAAQDTFYICILSTSRLVYKGMLTALQLRRYFPDLQEPDFKSALGMVHARFSTNTFPSWRLAHPFRYLAHNGEINTLRGNRNWMRARYGALQSDIFGDELKKMFPLFSENVSDSATLDNAMQLLVVNGRSLPHAALMLIPEAWQNAADMDPELRAFYEYHACLMEPWDGPAAITFTNGQQIGAILDRNGLRPARYCVTHDDFVILASEAGALPLTPDRIVKKGRLQPGRLFLIDMAAGRIVEDQELKQQLLDERPFRRWLSRNLRDLSELPLPAASVAPAPADLGEEELRALQHAFGYTQEDLRLLIGPMAESGAEPVGSMGTDTPLAVLSDQPQLLFNYFRQHFAQVTNPPLDAIREELVTSLWTYVGREGNLLHEAPENCRLVRLRQPVLGVADFARLSAARDGGLQAATLPMLFSAADPRGPEAALGEALDALCAAAAAAVRAGASLLILSDRGVGATQAPIPSLLATAAVHHHLIREGTRTQAGLVIDTGEARETHHMCLLLGYGASAVHPYLALWSVARRVGVVGDVDAAQQKYLKALSKAVLKVASKMGISTLQSYRGAQIFEAVGLHREVIDRYFTHTSSRLSGVGIGVIGRETLLRHRRGFPRTGLVDDVLHVGGQYQFRQGGEAHQWNPETVARLQHAVRSGKPETFAEFSRLADHEARGTLRGLLRLRAATPIKIEDVEPAREIVKRFVTGAMSFGSISKEAHETLAVAMNRLGGKSNTGEGGEDPARYVPDAAGDLRRSAIKQVASARFGVTLEYLVNADELQIKMAQGAKPGEGGQLPGEKVDETIARVRGATAGVGLISPPPHHDIYSIEDLAQLIYDLKRVNPRARVSVKLVSEVGVGTVAAGVAKARADHILISGDGGGTGAAPLTSLKHAGLPWELGLAEVQQVLMANRLRGRVRIQVDGQMKTGRDVVIAALLGAEEFGFATAPLIAMGCVMMRVCHLNTCPVGIATQDPELRRRFTGQPEHVVNYLFFVAEEARALLASLGLRSMDEAIGRADLLEAADLSAHWKARTLDLSPLLYASDGGPRRCVEAQDHALESDGGLDPELLRHLDVALRMQTPIDVTLAVRNTHRSVGAMLSGRILERCGPKGLPPGLLTCHFRGSAGQSFGAFLAPGVTFVLEGDSNDYLGKGLSGGTIVAYPPRAAGFVAAHNVIAGNVIGYGATSGAIFLRGLVGERFCVRNSGARAVVEGVGDHGCEYMTGGIVVVLGPTGRNFAAGMSGGVCYVLDDGGFARRCNRELVAVDPLAERDDASFFAIAEDDELRGLIEAHLQHTGSETAAALLADWPAARARFVRVLPQDYRRVLERRAQAERTREVA